MDVEPEISCGALAAMTTNAKPITPEDALDPSRALVPSIQQVNEVRVQKGFWPKIRRTAARIPFARQVISVWYSARDPETPTAAKGIMLGALAVGHQRGAMQRVQVGKGQFAGLVQRQLRQFGDGQRDIGQRRHLLAIQHRQPLQHQLAQHAQGAGAGVSEPGQGLQRVFHGGAARHAGRQAAEFGRVTAPHPLHEPAVRGVAAGGASAAGCYSR